METDKVTVVFQPSGHRGQIEKGKSLLEAAQELGVALESVCGGKHVCGKCRVRIEEGSYARDGLNSTRDPLSPFSAEEKKFISPGGAGIRIPAGLHRPIEWGRPRLFAGGKPGEKAGNPQGSPGPPL